MRFIVNVTIFSTHFFTLLLVKIKDDGEISSVRAKEVVNRYIINIINISTSITFYLCSQEDANVKATLELFNNLPDTNKVVFILLCVL